MAASSVVVVHTAELLVDLFLRDEDENPGFIAEGCIDEDPHEHDSVTDFKVYDQDFVRMKIGRDMKEIGEEINKQYKKEHHKSLADNVKSLFAESVESAGGSPEEFWTKFRDLQDAAMRDAGLEDVTKIMAAVLFSVKGLVYLGSSVRQFTLRYIQERDLDKNFKKMEKKQHPSLD